MSRYMTLSVPRESTIEIDVLECGRLLKILDARNSIENGKLAVMAFSELRKSLEAQVAQREEK